MQVDAPFLKSKRKELEPSQGVFDIEFWALNVFLYKKK